MNPCFKHEMNCQDATWKYQALWLPVPVLECNMTTSASLNLQYTVLMTQEG